MDRDLALQEALNPFKKIYVWKKAIAFLGSLLVPSQHVEWVPNRSGNFVKDAGDGKWHTKVRIMDPYGNIFEQGYETRTTNRKMSKSDKNIPEVRRISYEEIEVMLEIKVYEMRREEEIFDSKAWRRAFDIKEPIYTELCHEFYATYNFDEVVTDDELMTKKLIKFRLGGHGHTLTLLEFARRLGLYHSVEISEGGFKVYFQGGLRSDENFNARDYCLSISSEEELHLSRSLTSNNRIPVLKHENGYINVAWFIAKWLKRKGVGSQRESMIYCRQFITRIARRMRLLTYEVLDGLSAPIYCRALDTTTFRDLIGSNGRLIAKDPAPGVPRVSMPRPMRPIIQDLYDRMGNIEICQGQLERMSRR
ncbi:hypothetical protein Tco_0426235 [Tanacetum coccineum]